MLEARIRELEEQNVQLNTRLMETQVHAAKMEKSEFDAETNAGLLQNHNNAQKIVIGKLREQNDAMS